MFLPISKYIDPKAYTDSLNDKLLKYLTVEDDGGITTSNIVGSELAIPYNGKVKKKKVQKRKKILSEIDSWLQKASSYNIINEKKVSTEEILIAFGGPDYFKKTYKTPEAAYNYIEKNLSKMLDVL